MHNICSAPYGHPAGDLLRTLTRYQHIPTATAAVPLQFRVLVTSFQHSTSPTAKCQEQLWNAEASILPVLVPQGPNPQLTSLPNNQSNHIPSPSLAFRTLSAEGVESQFRPGSSPKPGFGTEKQRLKNFEGLRLPKLIAGFARRKGAIPS